MILAAGETFSSTKGEVGLVLCLLDSGLQWTCTGLKISLMTGVCALWVKVHSHVFGPGGCKLIIHLHAITCLLV